MPYQTEDSSFEASRTELVSWQKYIAKVARSNVPMRIQKAQKEGES
jgi:hypothetical protein